MGEMAGPAQVLSAGLQMYGTYQQGRSAKLEGDIKSIRFATAAEAGRVRAAQVGAAYSDDLNSTLANINAITAGQGRGIDSATSRVLAARAETINDRLRLTAMSNERLKSIGAEADADAARRAGKNAMSAAYLKMVEPGLKLGQELSKADWTKMGLPF